MVSTWIEVKQISWWAMSHVLILFPTQTIVPVDPYHAGFVMQ